MINNKLFLILIFLLRFDIAICQEIAYVDLKVLEQEMLPYVNIKKRLRDKLIEYKKEISATEAILYKHKNIINSKKNNNINTEKEEIELYKKINNLREMARSKKIQYNAALDKINKKFNQIVRSAIAKVSKKNNIKLVINKNEVLYGIDHYEITQDVITEINTFINKNAFDSIKI